MFDTLMVFLIFFFFLKTFILKKNQRPAFYFMQSVIGHAAGETGTFSIDVEQTFINEEHKYLSLPGLQVWSDHMIKIFFVKMYMQPECFFYLLAKTMPMLTLEALTKNESEKMLTA